MKVNDVFVTTFIKKSYSINHVDFTANPMKYLFRKISGEFMILKKSKRVSGILLILSMGVALALGALRTEYDKERITIKAPLPSLQLETLKLDLNDQGIFKKICQPRKLYLRIRKLHNTGDQPMLLKFDLQGGDKNTKASFKVNYKAFDIQKETFELAQGEKASLNLYLKLSKKSYQKGSWKGTLIIKDANQSNKLIGQAPIDIINSRRI